MLKYVNDTPEHDIQFRETLICLYKLSQWASISKIKTLERVQLIETIEAFSDSWRNDNLPLINKLHVVEAHLDDFVLTHGGWGEFGEQGSNVKMFKFLNNNLGLESLHHLGNVAEKCCFGINCEKGLKFFMKVHLVLAMSNIHQLIPMNDILEIQNDAEIVDMDV